ncbi:MAG: hypothetical protein QOF61_385, partial [Acidobacteriota bacterium]|nr:hypothetical protein [Acidobacteriota bacterium]
MAGETGKAERERPNEMMEQLLEQFFEHL